MYAKATSIIIVVLLFLLSNYAQAGVIFSSDFQKNQSFRAASHAPFDEHLPPQFQPDSSTDNGLSSTTSVSLTVPSAILAPIGLYAAADIVSAVSQSTWAIPPAPVLDGLLRPA